MAVDINLYVLVHTASDYVSSDQLEKEFVSTFILGDVMNCVYIVHTVSDYVSSDQLEKEFVSLFILGDVMNFVHIVKVEAIHGPLFVFKNYASSGDNAAKLFCTLPQKRWGQYFNSNKIQS
jgi:hypothetical protein